MSNDLKTEAIANGYERLRRFPEDQAESIAKHYVAHATVALTILKIIESGRGNLDRNEELELMLQMLVDQIKTNHAYDLGIELKWPK